MWSLSPVDSEFSALGSQRSSPVRKCPPECLNLVQPHPNDAASVASSFGPLHVQMICGCQTSYPTRGGKQIHLIPPTYKLLLSKYRENHYDFFCFIAFGSQLTLSCLLWLPANKKTDDQGQHKRILRSVFKYKYKVLATYTFLLTCLPQLKAKTKNNISGHQCLFLSASKLWSLIRGNRAEDEFPIHVTREGQFNL